jgi:hypothetical protein
MTSSTKVHRNFGRAAAVVLLCATTLATTIARAASDLAWKTYNNAEIGFTLPYPSRVFSPFEADPTEGLKSRTSQRAGRAFRSVDGKAWLQAVAFANFDRLSLQSYKRRTASGYAAARITFDRDGDDHFILSGFRGKDIFYERVIFSCAGRIVNVWQMTYPAAERALYDRVVEEIARNFRPVEGRDKCT